VPGQIDDDVGRGAGVDAHRPVGESAETTKFGTV
jgi:hypothetical protein